MLSSSVRQVFTDGSLPSDSTTWILNFHGMAGARDQPVHQVKRRERSLGARPATYRHQSSTQAVTSLPSGRQVVLFRHSSICTTLPAIRSCTSLHVRQPL